jgi:nucleotide-binding universal stress UspA family protein
MLAQQGRGLQAHGEARNGHGQKTTRMAIFDGDNRHIHCPTQRLHSPVERGRMNTQTLIPHTSVDREIRLDKILLATDFSEASRHAERYAVALARLFGARLFALHVGISEEALEPYGAVSPYLMGKIRQARDLQMRLLQESLQSEGIPSGCILEEGDIKDKINEIIQNYSIDLVVLGTHGRQGIARVLVGSTAENVFRSTGLPVLTVGPNSADSNPDRPITHIIYATDFTRDSEITARYALSIAQRFHAGLTVMHVIPEGISSVADEERLEKHCCDKLRKLVPEPDCEWCHVEHLVEHGDVVDRIVQVADEQRADLIVLGVHNAIQFMSPVPERTAYQIICRANCPVLTILPKQ